MLSILIPVYNYPVLPLVKGLQQQLQQSDIVGEIICLDDASTAEFKIQNAGLVDLEMVNYIELPFNVGRSRIRNLLADRAQYDYLLFMDNDSGLVNSDYIDAYTRFLTSEGLLYGGRIYQSQPPAEQELFLHWLYGKSREEIPVERRQKRPYHSFMTNNFLIPKAIFQSIRFDERLRQYGHEDTIFGWQLEKQNVPILHIHNPLEHLGLESADSFLKKTEQALENLVFLEKEYPEMHTRIGVTASRLERAGLDRAFLKFYSTRKERWKAQLKAGSSKLYLFDLYRLGYLLECRKGLGC